MSKLGLIPNIIGDRHTKLTTRQLRENLAEVLSFASKQKGAVVLTKNGEERAALVSVEDLWMLDLLNEIGIRDTLRGELKKEIFWETLKRKIMEIDEHTGNQSLENNSKILPL